jgi:hypothetical protein
MLGGVAIGQLPNASRGRSKMGNSVIVPVSEVPGVVTWAAGNVFGVYHHELHDEAGTRAGRASFHVVNPRSKES